MSEKSKWENYNWPRPDIHPWVIERWKKPRQPAGKVNPWLLEASPMKSTGEQPDHSGPWDPNMKYSSFSKEFLLKLIQVYQYAWLQLAGFYYDEIKKRVGAKIADECHTEAWMSVAERIVPMYAQVGNIKLNTLLDSMKVTQLCLDNNMGGIYRPEYYVINPNKVHMIITECKSLEFWERRQPEKICWGCQVVEIVTMQRYLVNPYCRVVPLKLPPRNGPEDIPCAWEWTLEKEITQG